MPYSIIDFSAQFGGQDAADIVLPHFRALKSAARGLDLEGFPFPELAFILRVDGEVHSFGFSGAKYLEIDRRNKYLSIDIGIEIDDRDRVGDVIKAAIASAPREMQADDRCDTLSIDYQSLEKALNELVSRYVESCN